MRERTRLRVPEPAMRAMLNRGVDAGAIRSWRQSLHHNNGDERSRRYFHITTADGYVFKWEVGRAYAFAVGMASALDAREDAS